MTGIDALLVALTDAQNVRSHLERELESMRQEVEGLRKELERLRNGTSDGDGGD